MRIGCRAAKVAACAFLMLTIAATAGRAATLPTGFTEALVASGLNNPTAMQFAPDGRLFVCEQGGRLRVIKDGVLLSTPFLTVTVSSSGERGLLGVAFDPNFAVNQYVYVYYTATSPTIHNRVSRFTANGDVAVPGSEVALLDLETLSATNHNGGALAFGPDGKLYIAVGENAVPSNAQSLANRLGKILRVNKDGTIPGQTIRSSARQRATTGRSGRWDCAIRSRSRSTPSGTSMFINDVGQGTWEEINEGRAGANYGWPTTEGSTTDPRFDTPRHSYPHSGSSPTPCAIAGGAFYTPAVAQFPSDYLNDYFFADYCAGWIRRLDPVSNIVTGFATGISSPVDLKVADDGSLYYLARGGNAVYRISYGGTTPTITSHPTSRTVAPGAPVTFSVRASGPAPLRYQWQRNGANISGGTAEDYTLASAAAGDNGARFRAVVSNDHGSTTSAEAVLTVTSNQGPTASITSPAAGTLYSGAQVIAYAGSGTDPEDGPLPASAFTWQVDFHHDAHIHPFVPATSGATGGSFTIPTTGHTESNVWYRLYLTVRDAAGATQTVHRDILPRKVSITLATSPAGLQLRLDGQPVSTPLTFEAVVGIERGLEAAASQPSGGTSYEFVSWSDGGAAAHTVNTPAANTTYTATYRATGSGPAGLIGHWQFEEGSGPTASDASPSGNHGSIAGATPTTGKVGSGGLSFSGAGQYVAASGNNNNTFTASAWFKTSAPVSNWTGIVEYSTAAGTRRGILLSPAGLPAVTYGAGSFKVAAGSRVDDGAWHHLAATFDGTTPMLYLDGQPLTLGATSAAASTAGSRLRLGDLAFTGYYFRGVLDEVRLYDRALSSAEISAVYNDGGSQPPDTVPPVISSIAVSSVTSSSAVLTWTTDEPADTQVNYGTTTAYGASSALDPALRTSHSVTLSGLSPGTAYHAQLESADAAGNLALSADVSFATQPLGSGPPLSGLIGRWQFEEGAGAIASDASPSGNHGSIVSATYATGRIGTWALSFTGSSQYVSAAGNNNTSFTTSVWFKTSGPSLSWTGLVEYSTATGLRRGLLLDPAGRPAITYGSGYYRVSTGGRVDDGAWHHLAATYDGVTAVLYLDGQPVTLGPTSSAGAAAGSRLRIGDLAFTGYYFKGLLDEVLLYDRALSAAEITGIFTAPM